MNVNRILKIAEELNIPKKDIKSIIEYLDNNEFGIAFEILCATIEQEHISISESYYNEIKKIGEYMEMDKNLWEVFRV